MPNSSAIVAAIALFASLASSAADLTGVHATLITETAKVIPGKPFRVGILIAPEPGFHIYYRSPGIVGAAPRISWDLPSGFTASPTEWPVPEPVLMYEYAAYGYRTPTLLMATITPPAEAPEDFHIGAKLSLMACSKTCHPGVTTLTVAFPNPRPDKATFAAADLRIAAPQKPGDAFASFENGENGSVLVLSLPQPVHERTVFIPDANLYDPNQPQERLGKYLRIPLMDIVTPDRSAASVSGLIGSFGSPGFHRVELPLRPGP